MAACVRGLQGGTLVLYQGSVFKVRLTPECVGVDLLEGGCMGLVQGACLPRMHQPSRACTGHMQVHVAHRLCCHAAVVHVCSA
jgi:hypothetical protein